MSTNPFKSTNRFAYLEDDAFQNKVEKVGEQYNNNNGSNNNNNGSNNNNNGNNKFLRKHESTYKSSFVDPKPIVKEFTSEQTLETEFPSIVCSTNNHINKDKDAPSFKTILNTKTENQEDQIATKVLPPGWLRLDSNTCYTADNKPEPPLKEVMEHIIGQLDKNYEQYKENYDSIHGLNAYMEMHWSEPIYNSDDDDNDDYYDSDEHEQNEIAKEG